MKSVVTSVRVTDLASEWIRVIARLIRAIDLFTEWTGKLFSWVIALLVGLSVYEVITRRLLGSPTIWTHEVLGYIFGAHVMLAVGYTLLHNEHVNVDFIVSRFSEKRQALIDVLAFIVFLGPLLYVLLTQGYAFAARAWAVLERAPSAFNSPVYPAKTLIPVGALLLTIQAFSHLIRKILFLVTGVRV